MADLSQQQIDFRNAMAQLPAAVNIITTNGPGGRCGITASAVCSVTDSPPTVLVCVNRNSATHDVFRTNGHLCVNVLCGEQEELARHFAGMTKVPMDERFAWDLWDDGAADVPVLRDALVQLETAGLRHTHVEHQAGGLLGVVLTEELFGAGKALRLHADRFQQPGQRGAQVLVIVNDVNNRFAGLHQGLPRKF